MMEPINRSIPRMRTAAKVAAEIKILDPDSEVTEYWVRQLIKSGSIPVVWAGNKALINLDAVLERLYTGTGPKEPKSCTVGGIRRVNPKQR